MSKRLFATIYSGDETQFLSIDELEIKLARGQIGQDSHILCPPLTGELPQPIWTIESLRTLSNTPEARMMDHLRSDASPLVSIVGLLLIIIVGLVQQRGWLVPLDWGIGWSTIAIQDRWWTPWTHWLLHLDLAHWVGNGVLFYFCAQRVEGIIGSISLIWVLSMILWGSSLAIWLAEPNVVVGASSLVFGLWAMQVGLGLRLADSLPNHRRTHYGWGNLIVFLPMLVLNTLSVDISNIAHWSAMAIGGILAFAIRPQTGLPPTERRPKSSIILNAFIHGCLMMYCVQLTKNHFPNIAHQREDSGVHWVVPAGFEKIDLCTLNAREQAGIKLFLGTQWTSLNAEVSEIENEYWYDCGFVEPSCTIVNKHPVALHRSMAMNDVYWTEFECQFANDLSITEYVLKRGEFLVRIGCQANPSAKEWCLEWLDHTKVGLSDIEIAAKRQWLKKDQQASQALLFAQTLMRMGRFNTADRYLHEVELRFDEYQWRGTEDRLRLHLLHPTWKGERFWLEQIATSLPIQEIEVLRLVVILSLERGWCDIAAQVWLRWRGMMSTGLDDVETLVNQCIED